MWGHGGMEIWEVGDVTTLQEGDVVVLHWPRGRAEPEEGLVMGGGVEQPQAPQTLLCTGEGTKGDKEGDTEKTGVGRAPCDTPVSIPVSPIPSQSLCPNPVPHPVPVQAPTSMSSSHLLVPHASSSMPPCPIHLMSPCPPTPCPTHTVSPPPHPHPTSPSPWSPCPQPHVASIPCPNSIPPHIPVSPQCPHGHPMSPHAPMATRRRNQWWVWGKWLWMAGFCVPRRSSSTRRLWGNHKGDMGTSV